MKPKENYSNRFRLTYGLAALAVGVTASGWGIAFAIMGAWPLVAMDVAVVFVAFLSLVLARRNQLSAALLFSQSAFLVIITTLCLIFDVPREAAPRVSHLFLLVLALLGYINYRREQSRPQLAIVALCVIAFVVFASTTAAPSFAQPIPETFQIYGSWVNTIVAVGLLCIGVYVMQLELARDLDKARAIKAALRNREFELFYQPQVDETGRLTGAEALLRWRRGDGTHVPPAEFIPAAEQAGLMPAIGEWVLTQACETLAAWRHDPATSGLKLAINVSADHFMKLDFVETVLDCLRTLEIDPALLKLELTESMMANDIDAISEKMRDLRTAGLFISLDDFGTGYSSLSHLRRLPVQEIKIDRSFVQDIVENRRNRVLLKSIFDMAHMLEFVVVAEGVETLEQLRLLRSFDCTAFQGYYFGRPVPLGEFQTRWTNDPVAPAALSA
ncbi:putative bifunctional diguanylate cyclase/phosphodiesterase [Shinella sedimenti]|uniref:EAL domain-containing protein n=1 Tax=Shinella sedimenti TaxID=2919913 RepID=A0ABT0CJ60_9HYPH|nr:EAL domain-containing protein [Shinella sedimenti]MCJ8148643.1 EAL domain-containing protein [Shinella sedimenti]